MSTTATRLSPITVPVSDLERRAGQWMLASGIQEESGGLARYYRADQGRNNRISTEITGYGISALCYLHAVTGEDTYLAEAVRAGRFLCEQAFDAGLGLFPFEWPQAWDGTTPPAYFFDCGIIVRSLLKLKKATGEARFLEVARACGEAMARRFENQGNYAPILQLPECRALGYGSSWSNNPGCYQLKSALAWRELYEDTGDTRFRDWWETALERALRDAPSFLPGTPERLRVMDRLHAFSYFLEALIPVGTRPKCREALEAGIGQVSLYLRMLRGEFVRSDVYAQLLRVRLYAAREGFVALNQEAAAEEAEAIPAFQYASSDARLDGGFSFGMREGALMPFANPVSTAFCVQAITLWNKHRAGGFDESWRVLI